MLNQLIEQGMKWDDVPFTYGKLVGLGILGLEDDSAVNGDTGKVGIQLRDSGQDSTLHS